MTRAVAPVVGILVLLGLTVVLAVMVGAALLGVGPAGEQPPTLAVQAALDGDRTIVLEHGGGDDIDVETLEIVITIDGDPLPSQPPVPFVGADGYFGAPSGPFHAESDNRWSTGERAELVLAGENAAALEAGETLEVTLFVDDHRIASLTVTVT